MESSIHKNLHTDSWPRAKNGVFISESIYLKKNVSPGAWKNWVLKAVLKDVKMHVCLGGIWSHLLNGRWTWMWCVQTSGYSLKWFPTSFKKLSKLFEKSLPNPIHFLHFLPHCTGVPWGGKKSKCNRKCSGKASVTERNQLEQFGIPPGHWAEHCCERSLVSQWR